MKGPGFGEYTTLDSVQSDCAEWIEMKSEKQHVGVYTNSSSALIAMARLTVGQIHYLKDLNYSIFPDC